VVGLQQGHVVQQRGFKDEQTQEEMQERGP
jgi:hypothetical protein